MSSRKSQDAGSERPEKRRRGRPKGSTAAKRRGNRPAVTLTLNQMCSIMRDNGIPVNEKDMSALIVCGAFPFAFGVRKEGSSRSALYISAYQFRKWLRECTGREPVWPAWAGPKEAADDSKQKESPDHGREE